MRNASTLEFLRNPATLLAAFTSSIHSMPSTNPCTTSPHIPLAGVRPQSSPLPICQGFLTHSISCPRMISVDARYIDSESRQLHAFSNAASRLTLVRYRSAMRVPS